jgi:hypothetical protein
MMNNVLDQFVEILVGGISSIASGIGTGVNGFVQDLFLTVGTDGSIEGLSTFGGVVAIFGGVSLCIGLTTLVFNWVRSIGN